MGTLDDELHPVVRPGWALPSDPHQEFRRWLLDFFATPSVARDAPERVKLAAFLALPAAREMPVDLHAYLRRAGLIDRR